MISLLLLAPALGLAANLVMQLVLARMNLPIGPIRLQFVSFAMGGMVVAVVLVGVVLELPMDFADKAGYLVQHLLIYACFGFCFFNVVNANVSSLRVRILKELLMHDPVPMDETLLCARYSSQEMLDSRLGRLQTGGQIEMRGNRYYLRKRGLSMIGNVFSVLRGLLFRDGSI